MTGSQLGVRGGRRELWVLSFSTKLGIDCLPGMVVALHDYNLVLTTIGQPGKRCVG